MLQAKESLLSKIDSRELNLAIVGMDYVGLPLAVAIAEAGFNVMGIDVSA